MCSLILLLGVNTSIILLSSAYESRSQSLDMLEHYTQNYSINSSQGPGNGPPGGDFPPGSIKGIPDWENEPPRANDLDISSHEVRIFELSSFYSVVFDADGEIKMIDTGKNSLYSEEYLEETARKALQAGKVRGHYSSLLYQIADKEDYTLVAFMDNTVSINHMYSLARTTLIVGGALLVILFFLSLYVSRKIVQPLEENDQQQKRFVSDAGHELKTPISVISANADLLSRQIGQNEWLENIRYENERMGSLVKQLLDLSHAESMRENTKVFDLSRHVTGEVLPFESVAFEKGIVIQSDIQDGIEIKGIPNEISHLVSILLDNAIFHSEGGKAISLSLQRQGRNAVLTVENEATDIPKERMEHLFERFYRVSDAREDDGHHYGLGLPIAKAITEAHGGTISAASQSGRFTISISIPLQI